jgi:hypothetical protein
MWPEWTKRLPGMRSRQCKTIPGWYDSGMPQVQMERPLNVPVVPARAAASEIVKEISEERGKWSDFALYARFETLGLPDVGYVAIPVTVDNVKESLEPRHEISFRLRARRSKELFPMFDGGIGIDGTGPSNATMWLSGTYDIPMKGLGIVLNSVVLPRVAEQSLTNMLNELADAIEARVQKRQIDDVRYRLIFNAGD